MGRSDEQHGEKDCGQPTDTLSKSTPLRAASTELEITGELYVTTQYLEYKHDRCFESMPNGNTFPRSVQRFVVLRHYERYGARCFQCHQGMLFPVWACKVLGIRADPQYSPYANNAAQCDHIDPRLPEDGTPGWPLPGTLHHPDNGCVMCRRCNVRKGSVPAESPSAWSHPFRGRRKRRRKSKSKSNNHTRRVFLIVSVCVLCICAYCFVFYLQ